MKYIIIAVSCFVLCGCGDEKKLTTALDDFQSECISSGGKLSSEFFVTPFWASVRIKCEDYKNAIKQTN